MCADEKGFIDENGEIRWEKPDIDLQGRNLESDHLGLQKLLFQAAGKDALSMNELEDLKIAALHTQGGIEKLLRQIRYVLAHLDEKVPA